MRHLSQVANRVLRISGRTAGLLALLALLLPSLAGATLSIEPAFVELALDKGRPSAVITVTNVTDQETRYRAQPAHFVYKTDGNFELQEPDGQSLALWLKFNPREFTLAPKESRAIRLSVVPPKNLDDGEYWAALRFEPLEGIISRGDDGAGRSVAVEVRANILVPIVGRVGEQTYVCDFKDLKAWRSDEGVAIVASIVNTGTARVRVNGSYEIVDSAGNEVAGGVFGEATILAGGERVFSQVVEGEFPDENYDVRIRYTSETLKDDLAGLTHVRNEAPADLPGDEH
ncbi:MAG: hypothetical protein ABIE42_02495 [Candidatus Eisenbacteria bacterium]